MLNAIRVSRLTNAAVVAALGVAFVMGVSAPLKAETSTGSEAVVTFDYPVEVPGTVLPPGSYLFKALDNNELVQIFSADQRQFFATVAVVPEDRPSPDVNLDSFVSLNKTRAGAPQEVEGFFLGGRSSGFKFVYPSTQVRHHRG
jgi:hypothetical protein